jgi:predicted enzyme related to lactoylglutathione lyase
MFQRLRTIVYAAPDLAAMKEFYCRALGQNPYFDEPFYIGFDVNGYELGLDPNAPADGLGGPVTYWRVADVDAAYARLLALGATVHEEVHAVGGGIRLGSVVDPCGNVVGVIDAKEHE